MHIDYMLIRGCKRFHLSGLYEIEAEFPKAVTIISGRSGEGKSSYLQELCPLPAVRTTYDKDGRKEIHLSHDGHKYELVSDFTNRVAPHSFKRDGEELNLGHTTDVQEELVVKHLGLTPSIRNLIYNKTTVCSLTKTERKNLFLTINPMDLSLVLAAHKDSKTKFNEAKAQLNHLYSRKADLENQMLKPEILERHKATKQKLENQLNEIDKLIYALEQHVNMIKTQYKSDLEYREECTNHNRQLIPSGEVVKNCHEILRLARRFTSVERGEGFSAAKEELRGRSEQLQSEMDNIQRAIVGLSKEVDEYQQHLDRANETPVSALEKDLADIEEHLKAYRELPKDPIPKDYWANYESGLESIREELFYFRDLELEIVTCSDIEAGFKVIDETERQVRELRYQLANLKSDLANVNKDLQERRDKASIPSNCTSTSCGLRMVFSQQTEGLAQKQFGLTQVVDKLEKQLIPREEELKKLQEHWEPYRKEGVLKHLYTLGNRLNSGYYAIDDWNANLVQRLRTQPMLILQQLQQRLEDSKCWYDRDALLRRKQELSTKLETLLKSSGASIEFLTAKVKEKELQIRQGMQKYDQLEAQRAGVLSEYNLYVEYTLASDQMTTFQEKFTRGERALIVHSALEYWKDLGRRCVAARTSISEELRQLETIVRDQEAYQRTYRDEILTQIAKIEKDKEAYARIEMALSPNTGIPHKSMVRYLNALIHNVNYFLAQIWNYPMKIQLCDPNSPLDYGLRIDVSGTHIADLSQLSEGQTEVTNLMWVLTILLQLKMLNKIPLYADEVGRAFDAAHRVRLLNFFNQLVDNKYIDQMFLVSHYTEFINGFTDADIIHFGVDPEGELPRNVNDHIRFTYGR